MGCEVVDIIKILIVEDDPAISDLISMNLNMCNYHCDAVFDGNQALKAIEGKTYDLALLDVMLPEKDGFELIAYMNKKNIPVIYASARSEAVDRIKGLQLGAEDYIIKPFDITELMLRVKKVISRRRPEQRVYTVCGATIDEDNHTVSVDGKPVELKNMEFALMLMLSKHRGMAFTREQLLHTVWGDEFIGETRTVDVHIAALRKKLHWSDAIQTVYRIGYRLRKED